MSDLYGEFGELKYQSMDSIVEGLQEIVQTLEERSILSEMFADVSYENEGYYYNDKARSLLDKIAYEKGCNSWDYEPNPLFELALLKMRMMKDEYGDRRWLTKKERKDLAFLALHESDVAIKLGLHKLLAEKYDLTPKEVKRLMTEWHEAWHEASEFYGDFHLGIIRGFIEKLKPNYLIGRRLVHPYEIFNILECKVTSCNIDPELLTTAAECQSFLFSYEDFIQGLRANQALYNYQQTQYNQKLAELQAAYAEQVKLLYNAAAAQGVVLELPGEVVALPGFELEIRNEE